MSPERNVLIDDELYYDITDVVDDLQGYLTNNQDFLDDDTFSLLEKTTDLLDRVLFSYENSLEKNEETFEEG